MISSTDENKLISDPSGSDTFTKRRRRRRKRKRNNGNKKQQQHLQIFIQGFDEAPVSTGNKEKQAHEGQHQEMVSMGNDSRVTKNNSVLSKLLRRARYFDPPEERSYACRNCGEDGHREGTCTAQKPRRPCFGCGNLDHSWRRCKLRRNCFSCKGQGHVAKYCPYKNQGNNPVPDICLRCGDTGHDMFSCCNDYCPRDIQVCWIVYQFFFLKCSFLFQPPICIFLCSVVDESNEKYHYHAVLDRKYSVTAASLLVIFVALILCMHLQYLTRVTSVASLDIGVRDA